MKLLFIPLLLLFSACTIYSTSEGRVYRTKYKVEMIGAGNTTGIGASQSFPDRINDYLQTLPVENKSALKYKKIIIAFDYFFPSNFPSLNNSSKNHLSIAQEKINNWELHYDHIFIVKLPKDSDLMPKRVRRYFEEANYLNPYKKLLRQSSNLKVAKRVDSLNTLISQLAKNRPKINAIEFTGIYTFLENYKTTKLNNNALRQVSSVSTPEKVFSDPVHLSDFGQIVFFNSLILPDINKALGSKLPPMKIP